MADAPNASWVLSDPSVMLHSYEPHQVVLEMFRGALKLTTLSFARPEDAQERVDEVVSLLRKRLLEFLADGQPRSLETILDDLGAEAVRESGDDAGRLLGKAILDDLMDGPVEVDPDQSLTLQDQEDTKG